MTIKDFEKNISSDFQGTIPKQKSDDGDIE